MKEHKTHGGKRKGAGRPKGSTNATHKADPAVTRSVSMPATVWDRIDTLRGTMSRGTYITSLLPMIAALLLFTGCSTGKYQRMVTRPDGSYKIIPCDQKELSMTVDGDTTFQNFDIVKFATAASKTVSPP